MEFGIKALKVLPPIDYPSVDGNYAQFYIQVKQALEGGPWPVTIDEALAVAKIIDEARETSFR
ncbi:MAG: hypothetical protein RLZZ154_792 [Actinomycetota bacterium]